jgi:hypothetical protein
MTKVELGGKASLEMGRVYDYSKGDARLCEVLLCHHQRRHRGHQLTYPQKHRS